MEYGFVAVWLITYLALGLAALPTVARLLDGFYDHGASFAVPMAFLTLGLVGFLAGHIPGAFGLPAVLAGLFVLAAVSYRFGDEVELRRALVPSVLFSIAFLFVVGIRAFDPAVTPLGGEKFLDFGLLRTLLRSDTLPPEDMWFANAPVKYYYGGHLLTALLAELTFTPARYAYNLALAGFYAAFVTAAYGLAATVADGYGVAGQAAGALSAFFVALAANLHTAGQLVAWVLPDTMVRPVIATAGLEAQELLTWTPTNFYYWDASRIIAGTINEFPLFAWLNGDLHAHMMSTNLLLFAAALLHAYWRAPEADIRRRRVLLFGFLPPLGGYVATVNTWSFPAVTLGLPFLVLTFAPARPWTLLPKRIRDGLPRSLFGATEVEAPAEASSGPAETDGGHTTHTALLRTELARSGTALALAAGVLLLAVAWVAPFWFVTASGRPIGLFPPGSGLGGLLVVHGGFLSAFTAYLTVHALSTDGALKGVAAGAAGILFVGGLVLGANAVAIVGPLLVGGWFLLRDHDDLGFETVLVVGGAGIVLLVEYVYVAEAQYAGTSFARINTVFKTYAQVWALWAPAAGVILARLAAFGRKAVPPLDDRRIAVAGRVLAIGLVLSTGVYAVFAVPAHIETGSPTADEYGPTLDATAFVDVRHPDEAAAIEYVDALEGQPTIATAAPAGYRWNSDQGDGASAPASLTGVPTLAGWFHEAQYRSQVVYDQRVADTRTIYTGTPAEQRAFIEQYEVEYVYVGPAERARYGEITVSRLESVQAVQRGEVTIYVVERQQESRE
jgi:YYY domain-containing protein